MNNVLLRTEQIALHFLSDPHPPLENVVTYNTILKTKLNI